jgi:hypothetical protein
MGGWSKEVCYLPVIEGRQKSTETQEKTGRKFIFNHLHRCTLHFVESFNQHTN